MSTRGDGVGWTLLAAADEFSLDVSRIEEDGVEKQVSFSVLFDGGGGGEDFLANTGGTLKSERKESSISSSPLLVVSVVTSNVPLASPLIVIVYVADVDVNSCCFCRGVRLLSFSSLLFFFFVPFL